MDNALYDPITNSEHRMNAQAGIKEYLSCTYLRAYIMASLCFEPHLIISDTSVNLNRAFRTLVDHLEGEGNYKLDYIPPKADFDWLIQKGHIRFASRYAFKENLFQELRKSQMGKQAVDLPSERYVKKVDELCSDKYVYRYSLEEISQKFTSKFKSGVRRELERDEAIPPRRAELLRRVDERISDQETITYNDVKIILLDGRKEKDLAKDEDYQYIRRILRNAYDYNIPDLINVDCCMQLKGIKPSRSQDWMLKLEGETSLKCGLLFSVYGFSLLPAKRLPSLWESSEYQNFSQQISQLRAGTIHLDEYVISLKKYLEKINEEVTEAYEFRNGKATPYEKGTLSSIPIRVRHYFKEDNGLVVAAKIANDVREIASLRDDFLLSILQEVFFKALPVWAKKTDGFPEPPEEIREAIVLQSVEGQDKHRGGRRVSEPADGTGQNPCR